MAYRFNDQAGRFVNERGQFVAESTVRRVVNGIADAASDGLAQASLRLLDGELSLAAWQAEAMRTIKLSQVATATIAHGGAARMGPAQYGAAGREIRNQYEYLRTFAEQVASGEQPLNSALTARARQYGQAARVTFEREYRRDQQRRGYQSEQNVLAPAEHCAQCREQSARGWVPVGSLVPVGQRICRANCRCSLRYARDAAQAA
jgi:hypothetical protein